MFRAISRLLALAFCLFIITPVSGQGLPNSPPEEVGLSSERLRRINAVMQSYIDERKLAGLVTLVARRGKIVHFEKFGAMEIEKDKRMQFDTIFQIASMTKPIVTVAVMMLYEEGRFQFQKRFLSGNGGLVSTPSDYARFCQMLLNRGELDGVRILGRKTVEFMTRNHLSDQALESFAKVLERIWKVEK